MANVVVVVENNFLNVQEYSSKWEDKYGVKLTESYCKYLDDVGAILHYIEFSDGTFELLCDLGNAPLYPYAESAYEGKKYKDFTKVSFDFFPFTPCEGLMTSQKFGLEWLCYEGKDYLGVHYPTESGELAWKGISASGYIRINEAGDISFNFAKFWKKLNQWVSSKSTTPKDNQVYFPAFKARRLTKDTIYGTSMVGNYISKIAKSVKYDYAKVWLSDDRSDIEVIDRIREELTFILADKFLNAKNKKSKIKFMKEACILNGINKASMPDFCKRFARTLSHIAGRTVFTSCIDDMAKEVIK